MPWKQLEESEQGIDPAQGKKEGVKTKPFLKRRLPTSGNLPSSAGIGGNGGKFGKKQGQEGQHNDGGDEDFDDD